MNGLYLDNLILLNVEGIRTARIRRIILDPAIDRLFVMQPINPDIS